MSTSYGRFKDCKTIQCISKDKKFDLNKIKGGLYGAIVGDAIGVPFEFHPPNTIPPKDQIDIILPPNFNKSYHGIPVGSWSDDSAGNLCLLDSLLECNGLNLYNFGTKLVNWMYDSLWAADDRRYDIGIQTEAALAAFDRGVPPDQSGNITDSQGNGSLMRIISLPLWYLYNGGNNDEELVDFAMKSSLVTHGHINNQVCCSVYCLFVKYLLYDNNTWYDCYNNSIKSLSNIYKTNNNNKYNDEQFNIGLNTIINRKIKTTYGNTYVFDTLLSVINSLDICNNYEDVIKTCISYGYDTDTVSCIAGGIAGIIYGYDNIPKRWLDGLRDKIKVDGLYEKFIKSVEDKK